MKYYIDFAPRSKKAIPGKQFEWTSTSDSALRKKIMAKMNALQVNKVVVTAYEPERSTRPVTYFLTEFGTMTMKTNKIGKPVFFWEYADYYNPYEIAHADVVDPKTGRLVK